MVHASRLSVAFLLAWLILPVAALADDAKDVKPIAAAKDTSRSARIGSFYLGTDGVAIRSAEELVTHSTKAESAKDAAVQKEMEAELAKLLKVDAIDWKKQMVLGVISDDFSSLKLDGKVLTATFMAFKEPGGRAAPLAPKVLVLIERHEGEVKFVKKK